MSDFEDRIKASLDRVVAGKEDFVYDHRVCRYVDLVLPAHGYVPSCLWGHVLVDMGVPADRLAGFDSYGIGEVIRDLFTGKGTSALLLAADASQSVQDGADGLNRGTWAQARDEFYNVLESEK
jgi:hypothetical protein